MSWKGIVKVTYHTHLQNLMDECIEWQVNYGYQKCHEFLIKIKIKHQNLPVSLSSIHNQNTIFIQISHIAKPHTHKSTISN